MEEPVGHVMWGMLGCESQKEQGRVQQSIFRWQVVKKEFHVMPMPDAHSARCLLHTAFWTILH